MCDTSSHSAFNSISAPALTGPRGHEVQISVHPLTKWAASMRPIMWGGQGGTEGNREDRPIAACLPLKPFDLTGIHLAILKLRSRKQPRTVQTGQVERGCATTKIWGRGDFTVPT